jgi:tetratricopeptide (TPR) repeat protein
MQISAEKGDLLLDIAWEHHYNDNPDTAYKYAERAIKLFDEIDDEKGKAEAYRQMGWLYARNKDYLTAEESFNDALLTLKGIDDQHEVATIYRNMGNMYNRYMPITEENLSKGKEFFRLAFEIRNEIEDFEHLAYDYFNLARGYGRHSKVNKVLEYYYKAIEIFRDNRYFPDVKHNSLAGAYANSGMLYLNADENDLAIEYYKKALDHLPEDANKSNNAIMLMQLSKLYLNKNQIKKSFSFIHKSLQIAKSIENKGRLSGCYNQLSKLHLHHGTLDSSLYYARLCLQKKFDNEFGHERLGDYYLEISLIDSAIVHYQYNIDNYLSDAIDEYKGLSECYKQTGDYKRAIASLEIYNHKNDSLVQVRRIPALNLSDTKQEQELANREAFRDEQVRENALKSKNFLQYSGVLFLIILMFLVVNMTLNLNLPSLLIKAFAFITVITLFEFTLVFLDPFVESITESDPVYKLGINVGLAIFIFPLHSFIENRMSKTSRNITE